MTVGSGVDAGRYKAVRGLVRGLGVLKALNERPAGYWGIADLCDRTGLHHTTLKRVLETLRILRYVEFHAETGRYHLTCSVRGLSGGYRDDDVVASAGGAALPGLVQDFRWPLLLSTLDGDAMLTRVETHHLSHLAFHRTTFGYRFPLLETAMGRAFLGACQSPQRRELLRVVKCGEPNDSCSIEELENRVHANVADGLGYNDAGWGPFANFSAISAPIRLPRGVVGCLTMGFPSRVLRSHEALREFGWPLKAAAAAIAKNAASRISTAAS
jgi:IclR family mhp operon transcriptional activator